MLLFLLLSLPLLSVVIFSFIKKSIFLFEIIIQLVAIVEFFCGLFIALDVSRNKVYNLGSYFSVDSLSAIILITIITIGCAVSFYSIGYIREEVLRNIIGFHRVKQYYILLSLFLVAMCFAITTVNPIVMWIFIEATTLSTVFLISFYNKTTTMEAAWKYLIINSIGLLLGFFGALLFLSVKTDLVQTGLISWSSTLLMAITINPFVAKIAFIFILIGYGTKAGLVPMHTWLPDAYSKAPSPISALLSGALLNVSFLAILRFKLIVDAAVGLGFSEKLLIFFGIISIVVPSFIIFSQKNYKRLFAYSSIEHIGIVFLGIAFGGIGIFAALLHMIYHSLLKAILFFCAGNILLKYGTTKIIKIKGVLNSLPVTSVLMFLGFLAITALPPFGMAITEFYILSAGISKYFIIIIIAIFSLGLSFIGFLKHISAMTFGDNALIEKGELNIYTVAPIIFLFLVFIILGIYLPAPFKILIDRAIILIS
ncbi:MAG: proton-conducting transporter membrane subunit [Candidatus Falkowbacteria bacterium]|nr:proton-conducting transporter membrane subunit [Candidatus Falkowbacteria bacterium]